MKVMERCVKVMMRGCVKKSEGNKMYEDDGMVLKLKEWCVGVGNDGV